MVALAFGLVTSGCGGSDENRIQTAIKTWKEGALAKDVDKIMSIVSGDFSHDGQAYEAGSKAELRKYIAGTIEEGGFDGVEVNLDDMRIDIKGAEAAVYPIEWGTPDGSTMIELIFAKEKAGWRLIDMAIGGRNERRGMPKNAAETMARFDDNGDGQISTDEMPEPLRKRAMLIDANGDGSLTEEELDAAFQRRGARRSDKPGKMIENRGSTQAAGPSGTKTMSPTFLVARASSL